MTLHRKQRLRELIARPPYNGSQKDFGARVELSEGRISQITDDQHSFGEGSARGIARKLGLDDRYFEAGYEESEFVPIRRADVKFSNGHGSVVFHEDDKPPLSFRADFLRKLGIAQCNAVVVDADGISNAPKIMPGAVVLVDRGDTERLDGDFFAFRDDGHLLIKRLSVLKGVGILATADNPEFKPKNKVYTNPDPDTFGVIGRCRWVGTEL